MKFIKQKHKLNVNNFDIKSDKKSTKHSELLPNSIRCIICGPSNCGKTNVMISLLTDSNGLKFENVYVYSKSLHQPKYKFLQECLSRVKGIKYFTYNENHDIVKPKDAKRNSIFIFDDVACDKQDCMREYFSMGRHNYVDCFYLCQTYTRIPKHLIRDNANFLIIFKQDELNLKHIFDDHVNMDMSFNDFKKLCMHCWKNKFGFVVIDKESDNGRYRCGFDNFLKWSQ